MNAILPTDAVRSRRKRGMDFAQDRHRRAARTLGFALVANDADTWAGAGVVWAARLSRFELASIAYTALRALDPGDREAVFAAAHRGVA